MHRVRTPVGHEAWLVTDYAQVRQLLDDDRLGRSHREPERQRAPGNRPCSVVRWATSTPKTSTTPGRGNCCSRISRPSTCGR